MPTPHPTTSHHTAGSADGRPPAVAAMIEPLTATPSEMPICRLVDAIAADTPACSRGIPEVAALVMGALTSPNPTPTSA